MMNTQNMRLIFCWATLIVGFLVLGSTTEAVAQPGSTCGNKEHDHDFDLDERKDFAPEITQMRFPRQNVNCSCVATKPNGSRLKPVCRSQIGTVSACNKRDCTIFNNPGKYRIKGGSECQPEKCSPSKKPTTCIIEMSSLDNTWARAVKGNCTIKTIFVGDDVAMNLCGCAIRDEDVWTDNPDSPNFISACG